VRLGLNAGFVIEHLRSMLNSGDLVYAVEPGWYHLPDEGELSGIRAAAPAQRPVVINILDVPDPWHVMIGAEARAENVAIGEDRRYLLISCGVPAPMPHGD